MSTMSKMSKTPVRASVCASLLLAAGCVGPQAADRGPRVAPSSSFQVSTDGNIEEWPADVAATADSDFVYLRLRVAGEAYTLQSSPETTAIWLDTDLDAGTGKPVYLGPSAGGAPERLGVDLEVQFSPLDPARNTRRNGAAIFRVARDGTRTPVERRFAEDLHFAPTYAAPWYEVRLSRRVAQVEGRFAGAAVLLNDSGGLEGYSEPFASTAPPARGERHLASAELPARPDGAVRAITFNVLKNRPLEHPEKFKAILAALAPDVVLIEEWNAGQDALRGWFTAHLPIDGDWHVAGGDADVAIVSRFPLQPVDAAPTEPADESGKTRPVRFVAAAADTPSGPALFAVTHLKCCGSKGTSEDERRIDEARAINQSLAPIVASGNFSMIVLGGDLNLVGSRPPLDILRAGLGSGGQDLDVVQAPVLGDRSLYTWSDPGNPFAPGRLDFVLTNNPLAESFVLDTTRLDEASLARMGLAADDSEASDHLPVVVDLYPR